MYKAGKNWVVAPIVFLGLTAGLGYQANIKADNVSSSTGSNSENTQQSKANSLSSQSSVALKSSHSAVQPQAASKEETVNFAVQPTSKTATSSSHQNLENKICKINQNRQMVKHIISLLKIKLNQIMTNKMVKIQQITLRRRTML